MKLLGIFLILILFFITSFGFSQDKAKAKSFDKKEEEKIEYTKKIDSHISLEFKGIKSLTELDIQYLITTDNKSYFIDKDTIFTILPVYRKSVIDNTSKIENPISIIKIRNVIQDYNHTFTIKDWIDSKNIIINLDSVFLANKLQKEQDSIDNSEKMIALISRTISIYKDAFDEKTYYENRLEGKRTNKNADFLYDEGFGRRYDLKSSNFCTIYGRTTTYDNGDSYTTRIYSWYSYGYGKSYFEVKISISLKDYGMIVNENESTALCDKLIKYTEK